MLDGEINEKELVLWGRAFRTAGEIDRFCRTHTRNEDDYYETITEMILQCLGGEEQEEWRVLSDCYAAIENERDELREWKERAIDIMTQFCDFMTIAEAGKKATEEPE